VPVDVCVCECARARAADVGQRGLVGACVRLACLAPAHEPASSLLPPHIAPRTAVSVAAIKEMTAAHKSKTLPPFLKSAPVLPDWDAAAVKAISASQWKAVVLDETKHVVVEIYAPWCGHCQKLEPIWLKAAEHLENKYSDELVFVKMDGTLNEVEDINVGGFPTVLAFSKGDKTPVDLSQQMHGADAKKIVKTVKETFKLADKKREGEHEYEAAARRFKVAVKALKGSLTPAAEALEKAAAAIEKISGKKDEL